MQPAGLCRARLTSNVPADLASGLAAPSAPAGAWRVATRRSRASYRRAGGAGES